MVYGLKTSGEQMIELTEAFREITKFSEEQPCNLLKAANKARDLFKATLDQNNISVRIEVDPEISLDLPFHIATLTLANLFSNSKDALRGYDTDQRKITITAHETGNLIICSFTDNGPGIPQRVKEQIFELGKSTKIGGSGWGLYLVKRALRENDSWIELKSSEPGHTEFGITFPKAIINKDNF
jgi:signal transduction histidine kinase